MKGTLLEKYLTMSKAEFATYLRSSPPFSDEEDPMREAYRYAEVSDPSLTCLFPNSGLQSEKFVMRSQLDCVDRRLPGTGVFDIKTRACLPVRMDILNWEVCRLLFPSSFPLKTQKENSGYLIKSAQGLVESFEREYYDLIRSAFLKYGYVGLGSVFFIFFSR
jgi:hypothetical protein